MGGSLDRGQSVTGNLIGYMIKDKPFDPCHALGELIDNSCDAKAKEVRITAAKDERVPMRYALAVVDNGTGVLDVDAVFGLANHKQNPDERTTGMYGTGGTVAHAQLVWDKRVIGEVLLRTFTGDGTERVAVQQLGRMIRENLPVTLPEVQVLALDEDRPTGTTIRFTGGERIRAILETMDEIIPRLYRMYRLAIDSAELTILINKQKVCGNPIQWVGDSIRFQSEMEDDGKRHIYSVVCGEVQPGSPSGWDIVHLKRHINHGVSLVDFGFDLPPRFYGFVMLGDIVDQSGNQLNEEKWELSSTKDRLDISSMRKIGKELRSNVCITELLERLNESSREMSMQSAQEWLNDAVSSDDGDMEKRDLGEGGTGGVAPVGSGRKRNPKKVQPGKKKPSQGGRGFRVVLSEYKDDNRPFLIRRPEDGRPGVLELNLCFGNMRGWIESSQKSNRFGSNEYAQGTAGLLLRTIWASFLYPQSQIKDAEKRVYEEFKSHLNK